MQEKKFIHRLLEPIKLDRIEENGKRLYVTPNGNKYPSVTTALSYLSKKKIDQWRRRVGSEEADRVSSVASRAGTAVHSISEKYMMNDLAWRGAMPIPLTRFLKIKPFLDDHVGVVYGVEHRMYSDALKTAGTTDLICEYKNINTIVDFKTSARKKNERDILSYFLQCTAYAIMVEEIYGIKIEQVAILMAVHEGDPIEFVKKTSDYEKMTRKFFDLYNGGSLS